MNNPEPAEQEQEPDPSVVRRYVAEVSASAMSVEQLAREGRLDLQPSADQSTQLAEQWARDEGEGEGEDDDLVMEAAAAGGEDAAQQQTATPPPDKPKDTPPSETQEVPAAVEVTRAAPSPSASSDIQPVPSLSNQDLQEIRSNLQEAAREASDLLRDVEY